MENPNFTLRTIESLKDHTFLVEDYQRGYKWDEKQIIDLLNDIDVFEPDHNGQKFYCLQPVAIKQLNINSISSLNTEFKDSSKIFELIDGQQRLTTAFLILKILDEKNLNYHIEYRTRKQSRDFLLQVDNHIVNMDLNLNDLEKLSDQLNTCWIDFIKEHQELDNVDNYHFFKATQLIHNYPFQNGRAKFLEKIRKFTQLIWYNDKTSKTSTQLFANLNSGKIRLTGSELIKALFIIELENQKLLPEILALKKNEFALEWDEIEYKLNDKHFWSFIKGKTKRDYPNKIGYLFDVLCNAVNENDEQYSYRQYAEKGKELNWSEVRELFDLLEEWFNDQFIYHRIGFLLNQTNSNFGGLNRILDIKNEVNSLKSRFRWSLEIEIRKIFRTPDKKNSDIFPYHLDNIDFLENKRIALDVLVLFNIITYENLLPDYKINFSKFFSQTWTIEHIHPQTPDILDKKEAADFLAEYKSRLLSLNDNSDDNSEALLTIEELSNELRKASEKDLKKIIKSIKSFTDELSSLMEIHGIGNLTLLRQSENSKLNNSLFKPKRNMIILLANKVNSKDSFIPISTLNVFNKYYTDSDDLMMTYWYKQDSEYYKIAVAKTLSKFLPK